MSSDEKTEHRLNDLEKRITSLTKTINGNGEEGLRSRVTVMEKHIDQLHDDQKQIVIQLKSLNDAHKKAVGGIMVTIAFFNALLIVAVKLWT